MGRGLVQGHSDSLKLKLLATRECGTFPEAAIGLGAVPFSFAALWTVLKWFPRVLPGCFLHDRFGVPCPGCGTVHCAELILRGQVAAAVRSQPLAVAVAAAAVTFSAYSALVLAFDLPRLRLAMSRKDKACAAALAIATVGINWAYLGLVSGG